MERPWLLLNRVLHVHAPGGNDGHHAAVGEHGLVVDAEAGALGQNDEDHVEGAAGEQAQDDGVVDADDHVDAEDAGVGDAEDHVEAADALALAQAAQNAADAAAQAQAALNAAVAAAEEGAHEHGAGGEDQGEEDEDAGVEEDDVAAEEDDVAAEDAAAAAAAAQAQAQQQLEQSVVDTNTNIQASQDAHEDMHLLGVGSDIIVTVAPPPLVSSLATGPFAHPDPVWPDMFPYIVATGRFCLLVHFAVAPSCGTNFGQNPDHSRFVVVRHFLREQVGGPIAACADLVPGRGHSRRFAVSNIQSVGLVCDQETGHFQIAELIVTTGARKALFVYFETATSNWKASEIDNPLFTTVYHDRDWVPHGTVTINSTVLWYDLSWGLISCDLALPARVLDFHRLPHGSELPYAGVQDLHRRRCVAVSENLVRYVQIIPSPNHDPAAATVNMWYRDLEEDDPQWRMNYSVSFGDIWDNHSYDQTGLPRTIPMLVGVSPVDSSVVYFSLNQQMLGVNVPEHTLVHFGHYAPLNRPEPNDEPVTSRYFITWNLGADEAPNVGHQPDNPSDHGDSSDGGPADAGEIEYQTPPE